MFPNPNTVPVAPVKDDCVTITNEGRKPIQAESSTATKYLQSFTTRHQPPATVFCSRELEAGLAAFVESEVSLLSCGGGKAAAEAAFPDDNAIRSKAREILQISATPADDPVLMEKFKAMMRERLHLDNPAQSGNQDQAQDQVVAAQNQAVPGLDLTSGNSFAGIDLLAPLDVDFSLSPDMDLSMPDGELNDILQEIDFDFETIPELPCPLNQG